MYIYIANIIKSIQLLIKNAISTGYSEVSIKRTVRLAVQGLEIEIVQYA